MCFVQHVGMKSVFTIQPRKSLVSWTVKKIEASCHVLNIPFKDQNRQLCCLAVMVHIALQESRVATAKKKKQFHF